MSPGGDICGHVRRWARAFAAWRLGERVSCQSRALLRPLPRLPGRSRQSLPRFSHAGRAYAGRLAELVVVPAANMVPAPRAPVPLATRRWRRCPSPSSPPGRCWSTRQCCAGGRRCWCWAAGSGVGVGGHPDRQALRRARHRRRRRPTRSCRGARPGRRRHHRLRTPKMVAAVKRLTGPPRRRRGGRARRAPPPSRKSVVACARGGRIVTCGATDGYEPVEPAPRFLAPAVHPGLHPGAQVAAFRGRRVDRGGAAPPRGGPGVAPSGYAAAHRLLEAREVFRQDRPGGPGGLRRDDPFEAELDGGGAVPRPGRRPRRRPRPARHPSPCGPPLATSCARPGCRPSAPRVGFQDRRALPIGVRRSGQPDRDHPVTTWMRQAG